MRLHRLDCVEGRDGVKDPICGLVIPEVAVVAKRDDVGFCSESCAIAWEDAHRAATPTSTHNALRG